MNSQKHCQHIRLNQHRDELFIALQRLLPQHQFSRLLGKLAESETPWLKNLLIRQAVRHYNIDLSEALITDPEAYPSFNSFFTRQLQPQARPVTLSPEILASPADGAISQAGAVQDGKIFQAKGQDFTTAALLGGDTEVADKMSGGSFATIYLSPRDYHRVHMPVSGILRQATYIPGQLFSVNTTTANHVDGLFARNERLYCLFDTEEGLLAVVLVGALFVAGIQTVWQKHFTPGKWQQQRFEQGVGFEKGAELGAFRFGSTVIVVTEKPVAWEQGAGAKCKMGAPLGRYR